MPPEIRFAPHPSRLGALFIDLWRPQHRSVCHNKKHKTEQPQRPRDYDPFHAIARREHHAKHAQ